jgi:hypothetical protein
VGEACRNEVSARRDACGHAARRRADSCPDRASTTVANGHTIAFLFRRSPHPQALQLRSNVPPQTRPQGVAVHVGCETRAGMLTRTQARRDRRGKQPSLLPSRTLHQKQEARH